MTQDEIIEMAEGCGWNKGNAWDDCICCSPFNIEAFAKLVAQQERNEIIEILDASTGYVHMDAIRERGQA
jgi:hypothetical protein